MNNSSVILEIVNKIIVENEPIFDSKTIKEKALKINNNLSDDDLLIIVKLVDYEQYN